MNQKTILILFIILVPFLLLLLSYNLVFFFSDYTENQQKTVDFLRGETESISKVTKTNQPTLEEISHLIDVQKVMNGLTYFFYVLLFVCTVIFTYYGKKEKLYLLKYGGITTVTVIGIFLITVLISFRFAFKIFHQIFFPQGNWMFAKTSFLITTFPINFFSSMTFKIVLLTLILASLFILLSFYLNKRDPK